jgi:hypothetical protein
MPASLAGEFTLGEDAALCIVADECRVRGSSDLSLDEIADKASVGRSAAKSALRKARELGLITVQNRAPPAIPPHSGLRAPSLAVAPEHSTRH